MKLEFFRTHDFRRKAVHITLGTVFALLVPVIPRLTYIMMLLCGVIIAAALSIYTKYWRPKLVLMLLRYFDKPKDLVNFPGKGAVYYLISALISVSLFKGNVASASLIILAIGDPAAYFVGSYYGKNRMIINFNKLLEGTLAGIFFGTIAASFFVPPPIAFFGAMAGMIAEAINLEFLNLDDNITIPLAAGVIISMLI